MSFLKSRFADDRVSSTLRQEALNRIHSDPGIPDRHNTTASFWLKDAEADIAKRQSDHLPTDADVVIIGSGITGTSVAYGLLSSHSGENGYIAGQEGLSGAPCQLRVVMLDARDICSGATGRNGGHILQTCEEYIDLKELYGREDAEKITRFRLAHLDALLKVAGDLGISSECQARRVKFLSAYFDDEGWEDAKDAISTFKADMPEEAASFGIVDGERLKKDFHLPTALGAVYGTAGAIWPYRFVTGVLKHLLNRYPHAFSAEANTAVTDIKDDVGQFKVVTERGIIRCKHVVHCTNAHVGHLLPGMRGRIFSLRGQMSAQSLGSKLPDMSHKYSWLFNYERGYDYLTQLPISGADSDGEMMLGGAFAQTEGFGMTEIGVSTDSDLNPRSERHLSGALSDLFGPENWGSAHGSKVKSMWTGNMGFSADGLPWVGRLPETVTQRGRVSNCAGVHEKPGAEWIAAAFSGEGMVHAWLSGLAVVQMLLTHESWSEDDQSSDFLQWIPDQMLMSEQRYSGAETALPRYLLGHHKP